MGGADNIVYTIGHSVHPVEDFLALLRRHGIGVLADVRSSPYSRFNPQYNREPLAAALAEQGVEYVFLGAELGARAKDRACYRDGAVQYDLLAATPLFQSGLDRVQALAARRVALMCAEKDPLDCHRSILVARRLAARGVDVAHIHADGALEPHDAALSRLLAQLKIPEHDLFRTREEAVEEGYRTRGAAIAYQESGAAAGEAQATAQSGAAG